MIDLSRIAEIVARTSPRDALTTGSGMLHCDAPRRSSDRLGLEQVLGSLEGWEPE
jgi:hypothetical protein